MAEPQFGSPSRGDPTAEWEQMVNEEVAWAQSFLNKDAPAEMNRPPGTTPVPKEAQYADWQRAIADPTELASRFQQRAAVVGPELAAYELLSWDQQWRKHGSRTHG